MDSKNCHSWLPKGTTNRMGENHLIKMSEIVTQVRGVSYGPNDAILVPTENYIPILRAGNIQEGKLLFDDLIYIKKARVTEKQLIRAGDIVVAASSGSKDIVGKAAFASCDFAGAFGAFCKVVRPNAAKIEPKYLGHYFSSKVYRDTISHLSAGANINNIKNEHIDNLEIPLPPIEVQRKIATVLDKAQELIDLRKSQLEKMDEFLRSVFLDMFGDPVTNQKGWTVDRLDNVAEIVAGVTKGRKLDNRQTVWAPYMRVANVQDGHLVLDEIKMLEVLPADVKKYALIVGDLLATEGGDPDKLGRCAVWNGQIKNCIHQNHIFRIRLQTDKVMPDYVSFLLGSNHGKKYFLRSSKQTTGIASINSTQLKSFPTFLPPLPLQTKFASIVDATEAQKSLMQQSLTEMENNFNSLMQRAFRGDLF